jgi:hypothetical protein
MTTPEYDPNQAHTQFDPYPGASGPGYTEQNPYQYPAPQQPTYPAPAYPPPPGYPVSGYPAPGYAPVYAQPVAPTNTMAILSLVFAFVFAPLAVVFGHMARKQIRNTGEQGEGLATAGLIIGYIFSGLMVLVCAFYIVVAVVFVGAAGTTTQGLF